MSRLSLPVPLAVLDLTEEHSNLVPSQRIVAALGDGGGGGRHLYMRMKTQASMMGVF